MIDGMGNPCFVSYFYHWLIQANVTTLVLKQVQVV